MFTGTGLGQFKLKKIVNIWILSPLCLPIPPPRLLAVLETVLGVKWGLPENQLYEGY